MCQAKAPTYREETPGSRYRAGEKGMRHVRSFPLKLPGISSLLPLVPGPTGCLFPFRPLHGWVAYAVTHGACSEGLHSGLNALLSS